jgi:hypothetical protein
MKARNNKKHVLFLSRKDFAGSGVKLSESLNRHSEKYTARFIAYQTANYGAKNDVVTRNKRIIQNHIDSADMVHLKGDFPLSAFRGLIFSGKPIYQTVGGSYYRRKSEHHSGIIAVQKWGERHYNAVNLSGITPELTNYWIPHAIEVKSNIWKQPKGRIRIGHAPSNRDKKGTDKVIEALKAFDVDLVLMERMSNSEVIEMKKTLHLFIDQTIIQAYGMNAVECMSMGIPVVSSCMDLKGCPVERIESNTIEDITNAIERALKRLSKQWSDQTFNWAKNTHSFESICDKLEEFYTLEPKYSNMKKVEKVKVTIIKAVAGMQIGDTRTLRPELAKQLVKNGVAEFEKPATEEPKKPTRKPRAKKNEQ